LNTPVNKRAAEIGGKTDTNTPYLNGGLFEAKKNDWTDKTVDFPDDWFVTLYRHFDGFNFTTDESSPQYEQVAIDPEMLGRVFESLLATQFTETGEQIRKSTGAFYTPREIVAYMCRESVRQYLYTSLANPAWNAGVDKLLDSPDAEYITAHTNAKRDLWGGTNKDVVSQKILDALKTIAILDPACGSGAFPMGMLQLLLKLFERLDPDFDVYKRKLAIIQNNLYGVDIEEMAVEIARLRAWLSIIVDEEDARKVQPLPNLDFKFVRGNSLLSVDAQDLWNAVILEQLEKLKNEYFRTSDSEGKKQISYRIDNILKTLSKDGVFDFKIWFSEVFKEERQTANPLLLEDVTELSLTKEVREGGGFDIVIANPPYFVIRNSSPEKVVYEQTYSELKSGRMNIYQLFFGRASMLLNNATGIVVFIHPKTLLADAYLSATRKFLLNHFSSFTILNIVSRTNVFDAVLQSVIVSLWTKSNKPCRVAEVNTKQDISALRYLTMQKEDFVCFDDTILVSANEIVYKIVKKCACIDKASLKFVTGSIEWNKYATHLSADMTSRSKRLVYGENIQRYFFAQSHKRISATFLSGKVSVPVLSKLAIFAQRTTAVEQPRRIIATIIDPAKFDTALVSENHTNVFVCDERDTAYYILGVLNSRFMDFYFRLFNSNTQVSARELNQLPIPKIISASKGVARNAPTKIVALVDKILAAKADDAKADTSALEAEIDRLVYTLYGLTAGEIAVVEGEEK